MISLASEQLSACLPHQMSSSAKSLKQEIRVMKARDGTVLVSSSSNRDHFCAKIVINTSPFVLVFFVGVGVLGFNRSSARSGEPASKGVL